MRWLPFASACAATVALLAATPARAQDKAACLQAASDGQGARDAHKLVEARERFRTCAALQCPAVVQAQCAAWLSDVERSLPTVVVTAKDGAGADLVAVQVTVDGAPFAMKLDGSAAPLDPGTHVFHFELADGTSLDQSMVVREGAKDQAVAVVLQRAAPAAPPPAAPPPLPASTSPSKAETTPHGMGAARIAALVVGGLGVVGVGVGSFFGLQAMSKKNDSDAQCPGGGTGPCSDQGVSLSKDAIRAGNVSTVAFAVGLGALAGGAVLWFTAPSSSSSATAVGLGAHVANGGMTLSLDERF